MPSSLIHRFTYDPAAEILSIWLLPLRQRYDYRDVPVEVSEALAAAFSKGRFFNEFIRDKFKYARSYDGGDVED